MALFDGAHQRRIERLRDDHRRLGNRQRATWLSGILRAVGLDVHAVEQSGDARPVRTPAELLADELDLAVHALLDFAEQPLRSETSISLTLLSCSCQ